MSYAQTISLVLKKKEQLLSHDFHLPFYVRLSFNVTMLWCFIIRYVGRIKIEALYHIAIHYKKYWVLTNVWSAKHRNISPNRCPTAMFMCIANDYSYFTIRLRVTAQTHISPTITEIGFDLISKGWRSQYSDLICVPQIWVIYVTDGGPYIYIKIKICKFRFLWFRKLQISNQQRSNTIVLWRKIFVMKSHGMSLLSHVNVALSFALPKRDRENPEGFERSFAADHVRRYCIRKEQTISCCLQTITAGLVN